MHVGSTATPRIQPLSLGGGGPGTTSGRLVTPSQLKNVYLRMNAVLKEASVTISTARSYEKN